jgi:hypothetical protein
MCLQDSAIFVAEEDRTGDELTQELVDAWNLYTRVSIVHEKLYFWLVNTCEEETDLDVTEIPTECVSFVPGHLIYPALHSPEILYDKISYIALSIPRIFYFSSFFLTLT